MSLIKEFSVDAGDFATVEASLGLVEATHRERKRRGLKESDYIHSQFFGREKIEELLKSSGEGCVGLKISLILEGKDFEEEGLLIQAVDKDGNVLGGRSRQTEKISGGEYSVYGGPKCPKTCIPPPTGGN